MNTTLLELPRWAPEQGASGVRFRQAMHCRALRTCRKSGRRRPGLAVVAGAAGRRLTAASSSATVCMTLLRYMIPRAEGILASLTPGDGRQVSPPDPTRSVEP